MHTQVLATKLFAPPPRPELVPRPRLVERLNEASKVKLTLVSAPAGFGKTTLVSSWSAASTLPIAWLSLDEDDRDPLRFLQHVVWALKGIAAEVGDETTALVDSPRNLPVDQLVTRVVNDLTLIEKDVVLVLDDYHAAATSAVDELLEFLLERSPAQVHVVMTTRADPDLPLARLRARGQMTELRAEDLRFAVEEVAAFLSEVMGLSLSPEEITTLDQRTEGWIAALQLAALSMRGREDLGGFVRSFAGDHRFVFDFLVQEVVRRQPLEVRNFLLQTSVLRTLTAPLCDQVTGRDDSDAMLTRLERSNLFLTPLDDERRWYRYHALFADVLAAELGRQNAASVAVLHERASKWHEEYGSPGEAIRHALAAGDASRAAIMVERAWFRMDRDFQTRAWTKWASWLPGAEIRARPVLAVGVAWARLGNGDLSGSDEMLDIAERRMTELQSEDASESRSTYVADERAYRALPARIAAARAYSAQALGDGVRSEELARSAIELAPQDDPGSRGVPAGLLGLAHWARGELPSALESLRAAMESFRALGDSSAALSFAFPIADVLAAQGELRRAIESYRGLLKYAEDLGRPVPAGVAELHVGLAELLLERGERSEASEHLQAADSLGQGAVLPGDESRMAANRARVMLALGDLGQAMELLDEAARLYVPVPVPDVRPLGAVRARVWLALGRLAEAKAWAGDQWPDLQAQPSYVDEYALLTVARVLIADYRDSGSVERLDTALDLLRTISASAQAAGRGATVLEALVLRALALQAQGDEASALETISLALEMAEPEGYQGVFTDEGRALTRLLRAASRSGSSTRFARRLVKAMRNIDEAPLNPSREVEPLGERELDVLRMLRSELTGPQIARELGMSVHTLRTHTKNIYSKLGVHGRQAAVRRAEDLSIL